MPSAGPGGKHTHLCTAAASIGLVRVSRHGILAPAGLLPLHLDVIKGADAFVNCVAGRAGRRLKGSGGQDKTREWR